MPGTPQPTSPSTATDEHVVQHLAQPNQKTMTDDERSDARRLRMVDKLRRDELRRRRDLKHRGYESRVQRANGGNAYNLDHIAAIQPDVLADAAGTKDPESAAMLLNLVATAFPGRWHTSRRDNVNVKTGDQVYNTVVPLATDLRNGDPAGVLRMNVALAQKWATSLLAVAGSDLGTFDRNQDRAIRTAQRFLDLIARHVELIDRIAHGTRQVVRVERVVVQPGGQAIVGVVNPNGKAPRAVDVGVGNDDDAVAGMGAGAE